MDQLLQMFTNAWMGPIITFVIGVTIIVIITTPESMAQHKNTILKVGFCIWVIFNLNAIAEIVINVFRSMGV